MTPLQKARVDMHESATSQALSAFGRVLIEREAELIEELVSAQASDAAVLQARFKELREMRDLLKMPTPKRKSVEGFA